MLGHTSFSDMKGGFKALMKMLDAIAEVTLGSTPEHMSNSGERKYRKIQEELRRDGWL